MASGIFKFPITKDEDARIVFGSPISANALFDAVEEVRPVPGPNCFLEYMLEVSDILFAAEFLAIRTYYGTPRARGERVGVIEPCVKVFLQKIRPILMRNLNDAGISVSAAEINAFWCKRFRQDK